EAPAGHSRACPARTHLANHPRSAADRCQRLRGSGNGTRVYPRLRPRSTVGRDRSTLSCLMVTPADLYVTTRLPKSAGAWAAAALLGGALTSPLPPTEGLPSAARGLILSWRVSCRQNLWRERGGPV